MEIISSSGYGFHVQKIGPLETNVGFIIDETMHRAITIDAPPETWKFIQNHFPLQKWAFTHLLITHGHWDHMTDASHFSEKQIPIWAGQQDALFFQHPEIMTASGLDDKILPCSVEHYAEDGKFYEIFPKFFLKTLHVPGHSPGSIAYFFPLCSIAFVGDTLFANGIGRTDFPGGSRTLLTKSIRDKLYTLPDETIIVPGHGSTTSIAQEKQTNPYVTY